MNDAIRWPVVEPESPGPAVPVDADRSGVAAGAAWVSSTAAARAFNCRYMPTTSSIMSADRGHRAAGGFPAGGMGRARAGGRPIPNSSSAISRTGSVLLRRNSRGSRAFFKHANAAYQDFAVRMGFFGHAAAGVGGGTFQLYSGGIAEISSLRRRAARAGSARGPSLAHPVGLHAAALVVPAAGGSGGRPGRIPAPRHPTPSARCELVPFLGIDECLACARSTPPNRMFVPGAVCDEHGPDRRGWGLDHLASRPDQRCR